MTAPKTVGTLQGVSIAPTEDVYTLFNVSNIPTRASGFSLLRIPSA